MSTLMPLIPSANGKSAVGLGITGTKQRSEGILRQTTLRHEHENYRLFVRINLFRKTAVQRLISNTGARAESLRETRSIIVNNARDARPYFRQRITQPMELHRQRLLYIT